MDLLAGEVLPLNKRGITQETCQKFGYMVGEYKGAKAQIAPYYRDGVMVAQKVRDANKNFKTLGDMKGVELFGQHLWRDGGKKVVITEGEIDALSVSQLQQNKWPVVSIPNGSTGAKKAIQNNLEWLERFDQVVLMFDMDEPGKAAVAECAPLFSPGRCAVATLPLKDANEMLVAGRGAEVIDAIWGAKVYRPDSVLSVMDAYESATAVPTMGTPWPWPSLNPLTFGIHSKTSYYLGAGVGIGKTNWAKELQSWLVNVQHLSVGVFMLEESVGKTLKGIAGKFVGKPFHKPDGKFSEEELREAIASLDGKVFLYNHPTSGTTWDSIKPAMRYMVVSCGARHIFLDNLTVMVAHLSSSEANDEVNRIAKDISAMMQELDFTLYGFSHLNPPSNGAPHERGGKVLESQFTGSRALMRFGNYMFGLERNKDPDLTERERNLAELVLLKDREYGSVGRIPIRYYPETDKFLEPDPFDEPNEQPTEGRSDF
jgi:twinkle protein